MIKYIVFFVVVFLLIVFLFLEDKQNHDRHVAKKKGFLGIFVELFHISSYSKKKLFSFEESKELIDIILLPLKYEKVSSNIYLNLSHLEIIMEEIHTEFKKKYIENIKSGINEINALEKKEEIDCELIKEKLSNINFSEENENGKVFKFLEQYSDANEKNALLLVKIIIVLNNYKITSENDFKIFNLFLSSNIKVFGDILLKIIKNIENENYSQVDAKIYSLVIKVYLQVVKNNFMQKISKSKQILSSIVLSSILPIFSLLKVIKDCFGSLFESVDIAEKINNPLFFALAKSFNSLLWNFNLTKYLVKNKIFNIYQISLSFSFYIAIIFFLFF